MSLMKITGVPEHFNYPFIKKENSNLFQWVTAKGGSGQMREQLISGEVDLAIMLSEAAYKLSKEHSDFCIVGTYISSPLRWGVFQKYGSQKDFSDQSILDGVFGVSRMNSGSHLMAYYEAYKRKLDFHSLQFSIVGSLDGAREAFKENQIDFFLWEEQMCRELVKSRQWNQLGLVVAPWPAFVFICHKKNKDSFLKLSQWLSPEVKVLNHQFEKVSSQIAKMFHQDENELLEWKKNVKWSEDFSIHEESFNSLHQFLTQVS